MNLLENPTLRTYLRWTAIIAGGLLAVVVLGFVVKIVLVGAVLAALGLVGYTGVKFFQHRSSRLAVRAQQNEPGQ